MSRLRVSPSGKFVSETKAVGPVDFPNILANTTAEVIVAVPGALVGQSADWAPLSAALPAGIVPAGAFVATAGNVTFRAANVTAAPIDPPALAQVALTLNVI